MHLVLLGVDVSIHAPGRGATDGDAGRTADDSVSIHAPGRGATIAQLK